LTFFFFFFFFLFFLFFLVWVKWGGVEWEGGIKEGLLLKPKTEKKK